MASTEPTSSLPVETSTQNSEEQINRKWKLSIRACATVFAVIAVAIQIRIVVKIVENGQDYWWSWFSPESFAFLGLSLAWNCAEFITFAVNKHGIHPGAHVGVDLFVWTGLLISSVIQLIIDYWHSIVIAAASMKLICCLFHFVLFVWACVDTDRRRKRENAKIIAQVAAAMHQQGQYQNNQSQPMSTNNSSAMAPQNVPPGMALVPIELLAQLKQPQATYQPPHTFPST